MKKKLVLLLLMCLLATQFTFSSAATISSINLNLFNIGNTYSNTYIVGGPWLSSWAAKGTSQIAPHFTYSELRDPSTLLQNSTYFSQLKISAKQLQIIENVRGYYNNNASMNLSSGFRSFVFNNLQKDSWVKSFHTRGRATDIPSIPLYNSIYNEFKNGHSAPLAP